MTKKSKQQIAEIIARLPEYLKYEPRVLRDVEIYILSKNKEVTQRELAIRFGVTREGIYSARIRYESKILPALKKEVLE